MTVPPRPLQGLRVVEVAQNLAGPYCTRVLAGLGADVVKVEPPTGDAARAWGPPFVEGQGTIYAFANAGKRSVALDLSRPEGMEVLRRLTARADVLVESLRPGALAEMGLAPEAARAENPGLIWTSVLAYGETGPLAHLPGYEPLMQAHGGIMSYTGTPDGPPVRVGTSVVDMGTGMWAATAILAALRERDRTGQGARITGALFDTAVAWSGYHLLGAMADGTVAGRHGTELPLIYPYGTFPTADGLQVMVAVGSDALFRRLCHALDLGPLFQDARYRTNPDRVARRDELRDRVSAATTRWTADELIGLLRGAGVPVAPVRDVGELLDDEQFAASGMVASGPPSVTLPLRWDGARFPPGAAAPELGAHTSQVLEELQLPGDVEEAVLAPLYTPPAVGEAMADPDPGPGPDPAPDPPPDSGPDPGPEQDSHSDPGLPHRGPSNHEQPG